MSPKIILKILFTLVFFINESSGSHIWHVLLIIISWLEAHLGSYSNRTFFFKCQHNAAKSEVRGNR